MSDLVLVFISLGSNVGDRAAHLKSAVRDLVNGDGIQVVAASDVYESYAHTREGQAGQEPYLNAVVSATTSHTPERLLDILESFERKNGRPEGEKGQWAPRTLDLDILLYGSEQLSTSRLQVPHPRIAERRFVLRPMAELAPLTHVPLPFDASVSDLLDACPDANEPRRVGIDLLPAGGAQAALWPIDAPSPPRINKVLPDELRYIAIEGVIGAGKTTLARLFAERFGARTVFEEFEENPFLERFYNDMPRWAFQTQLAFLASRFRQQQLLAGRDLFQDVVVSDYTFDKDRIFARLTLSGDELALYDTMFGIMQTSVPVPDLVVYLQSTTERLMDQIHKRGRSYEEDMDRDYIQSLNETYNNYFFHYEKTPLLIVNSARLDFVKSADDLEELIGQIARVHYPGTTYYSPAE